jgi:Domain of unknown function (DUF397)
MEARWRKSSFSEGANNCVELAHVGSVRDSKDPHGTALRVELSTLLGAIKSGRLDR